MKAIVPILLLSCTLLAGCSETSRYVTVSGHPYKTDPECHRSVPLGQFDPDCDCPKRGIKNFCAPKAPGSID